MIALKPFFGKRDGAEWQEAGTHSMHNQLLSLFSNWRLAGYFEDDFVAAVENTATAIVTQFILLGEPVFSLDVVDAPTITKIKYRPRGDEVKQRFYDACGNINYVIDTLNLHTVLTHHFVEWVNHGYAASDFVEIAKKSCVDVSGTDLMADLEKVSCDSNNVHQDLELSI